MDTARGGIEQAVLLVGGRGERLRPLTDRTPKPLLPLLNRPLVSYQLELLARHGIADVVLAVAYRAEDLRAGLGDGSRWGVRLRYVEEPEQLGTAGALKNVEPYLDETFLVLNGDLVLDFDLSALAHAHVTAGAALTVMLRRVGDISAYGLAERGAGGRILAFNEKVTHDPTGRNEVNSGIYVMSRHILERVPAGTKWSSEYQLFPGLIADGETVLGHLPEPQGYWLDVGAVPSYLQAQRDLLGGAIAWVRPAGGTALAARLVEEPVCLGIACSVEGRVGPYVTLGDGCVVESGARVADSILFDNVTVGAGAVVRGSILGSAVTIAAGACITDEVRISDER